MLYANSRPILSLLERPIYNKSRSSSSQPPKARDFKPNLARDGDASTTNATAQSIDSRDPARGLEAAKRVVTTGKLDERYRGAARRYTALICATPIAIYLTYELYRRLYMGIQPMEIPTGKMKESEEQP